MLSPDRASARTESAPQTPDVSTDAVHVGSHAVVERERSFVAQVPMPALLHEDAQLGTLLTEDMPITARAAPSPDSIQTSSAVLFPATLMSAHPDAAAARPADASESRAAEFVAPAVVAVPTELPPVVSDAVCNNTSQAHAHAFTRSAHALPFPTRLNCYYLYFRRMSVAKVIPWTRQVQVLG